MLESRGIGAGSSPIGCEGFVKASKVQGSSLLLSNANNFVRYSYGVIWSYMELWVKSLVLASLIAGAGWLFLQFGGPCRISMVNGDEIMDFFRRLHHKRNSCC